MLSRHSGTHLEAKDSVNMLGRAFAAIRWGCRQGNRRLGPEGVTGHVSTVSKQRDVILAWSSPVRKVADRNANATMVFVGADLQAIRVNGSTMAQNRNISCCSADVDHFQCFLIPATVNARGSRKRGYGLGSGTGASEEVSDRAVDFRRHGGAGQTFGEARVQSGTDHHGGLRGSRLVSD